MWSKISTKINALRYRKEHQNRGTNQTKSDERRKNYEQIIQKRSKILISVKDKSTCCEGRRASYAPPPYATDIPCRTIEPHPSSFIFVVFSLTIAHARTSWRVPATGNETDRAHRSSVWFTNSNEFMAGVAEPAGTDGREKRNGGRSGCAIGAL